MSDTSSNQNAWINMFGVNLCVMGGALGLLPHDVALLTAAIMGNLSGAHAGIKGLSGYVVTPGINLLFTGESIPRFRRALDELLTPVLSLQEFLRTQAISQSRNISDLHTFPSITNPDLQKFERGKLYERVMKLHDIAQQDLQDGDWVPTGWDHHWTGQDYKSRDVQEVEMLRKSRPWVRHRPSMLYRTTDLSELEEMLEQSFDHRICLVDTAGGFFRGSFTRGISQGNRSVATLVNRLGETTFQATRLHPNQGYGTLHQARVKFLASVEPTHLAEILDRQSETELQLIMQAVLWNPQWQNYFDRGQPPWAHYKEMLAQIVNERITRSGPIKELIDSQRTELARLESNLWQHSPPHLHRYLGAFSSIIPSLLWAFLMLEDEKSRGWALRATEHTATHAFNGHINLIKNALGAASAKRIEQVAQKVLEVLEFKGPCSSRELQRSIYRGKQPEIAQAVQKLMEDKRISYAEKTREYRLLSSKSKSDALLKMINP